MIVLLLLLLLPVLMMMEVHREFKFESSSSSSEEDEQKIINDMDEIIISEMAPSTKQSDRNSFDEEPQPTVIIPNQVSISNVNLRKYGTDRKPINPIYNVKSLSIDDHMRVPSMVCIFV